MTAFAAKGAFATRYAAVIFPFVALLVAGGVTRFLARWVRLGALLVLCAFLGVGALWNILDTRTQAGQVGRRRSTPTPEPGDLVVYCPDQLGPGGSRAVTADVEQVSLPDLRRPAVRRLGRLQGSATTPPTRPAFGREVLQRVPADRGHLRGLEHGVQDLRGRLRGAPRRHQCGPAGAGARARRQRQVLRARVGDVVPGDVVTRW